MATADRVKETSTTTGTGDFTLLGAASQFQAFGDAFSPPPVRTRTRERLTIRPRMRRPTVAPSIRQRRRDEAEALAVILSLL